MNRGRQRGLGLAELLVAMAIGALVTLLSFTLLLAARSGQLRLAEAAHVDDAGRFALSAIERAVRQGGLAHWERAGDASLARAPAAVGLDAASLSSGTVALSSPLPATVNGSDVLALRFAGSQDGSVVNCAGFTVPATREGWSIFYVGRSARGIAELRCKYQGAGNWSADALVAGVDSFQVLYGLDTDAVPDGVPNRYVNATDIHGRDAALALDGANDTERQRDRLRKTHWKRVVTVKVALMLHGERASGAAGPSLYELFGAAYSQFAGGSDQGTRLLRTDLAPSLRQRERRVFRSTILLRNHMGGW
ncbi:PilW family protein [Massilia sp. PAMC28688]|uniref:PilW family protein n=1 Tax=Massilia sp. PAMC28688 TaxID=2861283 RepID=UPI001C63ABE5|nr:PilW family protein [Massilia sp. PAMC28688]QYF93889.1 PilW family protein [Massilia sp. PAMC28688]